MSNLCHIRLLWESCFVKKWITLIHIYIYFLTFLKTFEDFLPFVTSYVAAYMRMLTFWSLDTSCGSNNSPMLDQKIPNEVLLNDLQNSTSVYLYNFGSILKLSHVKLNLCKWRLFFDFANLGRLSRILLQWL